MPVKSTRETIKRQWELMKMLPRSGAGITAKELADRLVNSGFKVSKRQVERDLLDLEDAFPLECNAAGKPYGWRWSKDSKITIPGLLVSEALATQIVEWFLANELPAAIHSSLQPYYKQARKKLSRDHCWHKPYSLDDKVIIRPSTVSRLIPQFNVSVMHAVFTAVLEELQLSISLKHSSQLKSRNLMLRPLGLFSDNSRYSLIAATPESDEPQIFPLHEIQSAEVSKEPARQPEGFSLSRFLEMCGMLVCEDAPVELEAEIDKSLAKQLKESPLCNEQKVHIADGQCTLRATLVNDEKLIRWILSQGKSIKVTSPLTLVATLRAEIRDMNTIYCE